MNKIIVVLIAIAVAYVIYSYNHRRETVETPIGQVQPVEARLRNALAENPVNAAKLAGLVAKAPRLAASMLKDRTISISGTIQSFKVVGADRMTLRARLEAPSYPQVCLTFDARRYNTTQTFVGGDGTFEIIGNEALYYPKKRASGALKQKMILRTGDMIQKKVRFDRIEASEILFTVE